MLVKVSITRSACALYHTLILGLPYTDKGNDRDIATPEFEKHCRQHVHEPLPSATYNKMYMLCNDHNCDCVAITCLMCVFIMPPTGNSTENIPEALQLGTPQDVSVATLAIQLCKTTCTQSDNIVLQVNWNQKVALQVWQVRSCVRYRQLPSSSRPWLLASSKPAS